MYLRNYQSDDCSSIIRLFYETVHTVNQSDYSKEQLDAWTSGADDPKTWDQSFLSHDTIVAVKNDTIVGFGDIDDTGYLDRLFVHKDYQKEGIGSAILGQLESYVQVPDITVHASITARHFFENRGYRVIKKQEVLRKNVSLINYVMLKCL